MCSCGRGFVVPSHDRSFASQLIGGQGYKPIILLMSSFLFSFGSCFVCLLDCLFGYCRGSQGHQKERNEKGHQAPCLHYLCALMKAAWRCHFSGQHM